MNDSSITSLSLETHHTVLRGDGDDEIVAAIGIEDVAVHFRHEPPTGIEIERAIDAIEDALMATRLGHDRRGSLATANPWLRTLPRLKRPGAVLDIDGVEALFARMSAATSGQPTALGDLPNVRESFAALLILREAMHHLGFDRVMSPHVD